MLFVCLYISGILESSLDLSAPNDDQSSKAIVSHKLYQVFMCLLFRRHMKKREISKSKDKTTKSSSKNRSREGSNSSEGYNNIPLYSSVNNLTKKNLVKQFLSLNLLQTLDMWMPVNSVCRMRITITSKGMCVEKMSIWCIL